MTDYVLPTAILPASASWSLSTHSRKYISSATRYTQTAPRAGTMWKVTLTYDTLEEPNLSILTAFFDRINGQEHRILVNTPAHARQGTLTGSLLVNGAAQVGTQLIADGATGEIKAGDFLNVNGELKKVVADITMPGTIDLIPGIRFAPANNEVVDYTAPTGKFMLLEDPVWQFTPPILGSVTINLIEDLAQ